MTRPAQPENTGFPGIESAPDICGGEARIAGTRIPVWVLERARQLGLDKADLLKAYPILRSEHLAEAWAYVESHQVEMENDIRDNEEDAEWAARAREAGERVFLGPQKSIDFIRRMLDKTR